MALAGCAPRTVAAFFSIKTAASLEVASGRVVAIGRKDGRADASFRALRRRATLPLWERADDDNSEPQIRRDHPLNLSISISGGRETNQDSPSNGERSGKSSSLKSPAPSVGELWPGEAAVARTGAVEVDLERHVGEGESPVRDAASAGLPLPSESRVVWECSPKWVVNSI